MRRSDKRVLTQVYGVLFQANGVEYAKYKLFVYYLLLDDYDYMRYIH